jgi:uncharacterized protein (TIRG00374 family)
MAKYKSTILKILISSVFFGYLLLTLDFSLILKNIKHANLFLFFVALIFICLNYFVSSIRWKRLVITQNKVDLLTYVKWYFEGSFFNNFMPTSMGGDVYKIYQLNKRIKNKKVSIASTILERFTGIIALILIGYFGFIFSANLFFGLYPKIIDYLIVVAIVGFFPSLILGYYLFIKFAHKVSFFKKIKETLELYTNNKDMLRDALLTSFIVQFLAIGSQYLIFLSLGIYPNVMYVLTFIPITVVLGFVIPAINGVGIQDYLYVLFLGVLGVKPELALASSILYHFARLLISLIGGFTYAVDKK